MKRIWHPWHKWECFKNGFYKSFEESGLAREQTEFNYRDFLSDLNFFEEALKCVIQEWIISCEHFLSNTSMNRVAWLGQSSACYAGGLCAEGRGGYRLLNLEQQKAADELAKKYLQLWESNHENKNTEIHKNMENEGIS